MNQDLKSRIPVAITYVLSIVLLTLSGKSGTYVLLFLFLGPCLFEFVRDEKIRKPQVALFYTMVFLLTAVISLFPQFKSTYILPLTITTSIAMLVNVGYLIFTKKTLLASRHEIITVAFYLLFPFTIAISMTCHFDKYPRILLGIFIILWLNDAGAYFVGKAIGKTKLFPAVSPSKTWEGLIGGGIVGLLVSFVLASFLNVLNMKYWIFLAIIIWVAGSYGDLSQSSWKRHRGIKDSGDLMGGHGGFLDRLDSFIYAIPFVSLYLLMTYYDMS